MKGGGELVKMGANKFDFSGRTLIWGEPLDAFYVNVCSFISILAEAYS